MVREGERYPVTVENWASDGSGVARIDGMAVFVKGGIVGEECAVEIEHVGHRAAWAHIVALSAPAPGRQTPPCPHFGQCGGCQLLHMDYPTQLSFKSHKVGDALRRISGLDVPDPPIHGGADPWRYRNKVQFPCAAQPLGAKRPYGCGVPPAGAPGPKLGYFQERTHKVIDVDDCLLAPAPCAAIRRAVKDWMTAWAVPAYDEGTGSGLVRHLYIRSNAAGETLVCLLVNGKALPHEDALVAALRAAEPKLIGVSLGVNQSRSNVILGDSYRALWGEDHLMDVLCGLTFKLSVPSFYQVNHPQAEALYGLAGEFAALTGQETLLDLYCGTGTIGLTLAHKAKEVIGVEVVPPAVADARENAARNGVANARYLCADAGEAAAQLEQEGLRPDVIIVDPPRKGLSPHVVDVLRRMAPRRVVYVSCDPATLARDLKTLCQDYALTRTEAVDMFPHTHHVETVCRLDRKM